MENNLFTGYFCIKCNMIPLIQIVPKKNNIKILSLCKCNKQYHNIESFINNKYKVNIIDINKISNESVFNEYNKYINESEINISSIINKLNIIKKEMIKDADDIKIKIINFLKEKIQEINGLYKDYINKNNKIILFLENIIKSYQLIKDNYSNIFNILTNFNFNEEKKKKYLINDNNFSSLIKEAEKFYKSYIIISNSSLKNKKNEYFINQNNPVKCFLEIENNICAYISNYSNKINLCNLNNLNKEIISFIAHSKNVNWIIKSNKSNLISCGNEGLIKIWPKITNLIFEDKNNILIKEIKTNLTFYNLNQITNIDLKPIYEFKIECKENNFEKMLLLKDNYFLMSSKNMIFLFKYLIDEDQKKIELIKNYKLNDLVDIFIIEKDKKDIIAMYSRKCLFFLEIPHLEIIIYDFNV